MTGGRRVEREGFPGREESVSLGHRRSKVTWENGSEHSGSLCFADTEEVTGSNPVAPTTPALTSENAVAFTTMALSRQKCWSDSCSGSVPGLCTGWRAFPLLNLPVHGPARPGPIEKQSVSGFDGPLRLAGGGKG